MESIYAVDANNGLSKNGTIPWKSKHDMIFFMNKTKHNVVIMGKNTYFSLPMEHRPLKNRLNIVLTRTSQLIDGNDPSLNNVIFTSNENIYRDILDNKHTYQRMYPFLDSNYTVFCIGGKTIYEQFIPLCEKVWATHIKYNYHCDLFMTFDFSQQFTSEVYDDNDELTILEYTKLL